MDHVKTVISGKFRKAGSNGGPFGRSTVETEDFWDGKNENGKIVAPGVYYYKISTDSGERAFGKLVVAK
jgi:flagellar hook assembly protein FlgD